MNNKILFKQIKIITQQIIFSALTAENNSNYNSDQVTSVFLWQTIRNGDMSQCFEMTTVQYNLSGFSRNFSNIYL